MRCKEALARMDHAAKARAEAERRRRKFMQQRAVEQDRQAVVATYEASAPSVGEPRAGNSAVVDPPAAARALGPRPEELLGQVADRMTNRLRLEIREQLQKEAQEMMHANSDVQAKVEACLSEEIEKHCCPICYELMVPPKHTPMLSFPCGHTFCKACLEKNMAQKGACAYCRGKITSHAPNIALQQIIENFTIAKNAAKLGGKSFDASADAGGVADEARAVDAAELDDAANARRYRAENQRVQMRIKILANEVRDMRDEKAAALDKCRSLDMVETHLHSEEERVAAEIGKLQAELDLIRNHLHDAAEQRSALVRRVDGLDEQTALINDTLEPLRRERQKVQLLLRKFDPAAELDGDADDTPESQTAP